MELQILIVGILTTRPKVHPALGEADFDIPTARAVDSTMLVALGTLAASQTNGTQATLDAAIKLLNYAASHPDAKV